MLKSLGIAGTVGLFGGQPARSGASDSRLSKNGLRAPETVHDLFDRYDRRFAEAMLHLPERAPARPDDRAAIVGEVKRCLGIRDEWIPTISADTVRLADFDGGGIEVLRSRSWPDVQAAALLHNLARRRLDHGRAGAEAHRQVGGRPAEPLGRLPAEGCGSRSSGRRNLARLHPADLRPVRGVSDTI